MEIIWFASGVYGFLGAVLLIIFRILPQFKGLYSKRNFPFFEGKTQEEIELAEKHYIFYSQLWSFRLISTSFFVIILYSISLFDYSNSVINIAYILLDSIALFIISTLGIESVSKIGVEIRWPRLIVLYVPPMSFFFGVFYFLITFNVVDYIFISASIVSHGLFSLMWFLRFHPKLHSVIVT